MDLKTIEVDGKTYAEVANGKPIYVDDGKEIEFDASHAIATISRLNGEAKGHREAKEAAEKALKAFDGIDDPKAARKAIETMQGLDGGKLMDAEKAATERQKAVDAAVQTYVDKLAAAEERADKSEKALHGEKIGGSFARSQFIADKMAVPVQMVEATFGRHFTIDDGAIVAKDATGNQIYSRAKPGEAASFDEALEILVEASPFRDSVLKGRGQNGSGAKPGGGSAGGKEISRAAFNAMQQHERAKTIRDGVKVVDD